MITTILAALVLILAGVLGFLLYAMQYEHNKRKMDRQKRRTEAWRTVFQRTDLRA